MLMQKKKCQFHDKRELVDDIWKILEDPRNCPLCRGRLKYYVYAKLPENFNPEWRPIRYWDEAEGESKDVSVNYSDIAISLLCKCGSNVTFSEDGVSICDCGRVYRLQTKIEINEDHVDNQEFFLEEE